MAQMRTILQSHCNKCGGERNQKILHREATSWEDLVNNGRNSISGHDYYYLLKCAGCDDIQLRHDSYFSEDDPSDGPTVRLYPPAVSRREPAWARDMVWPLGSKAEVSIGELLTEIYSALQNDSRRSAAMALRALVETIMIDKIGEHGSIGENVSAFLAAGYVPAKSNSLFRDTLIEGGHAAMHRSWKPSPEQLATMMDLAEWLIESIYVHPARAAAVKDKIPPRGKK